MTGQTSPDTADPLVSKWSITCKELADVLRTSEKTVRRKHATGELDPLVIPIGIGPKTVRFSAARVRHWLETGQMPTKETHTK